jgi:hypothetical protein
MLLTMPIPSLTTPLNEDFREAFVRDVALFGFLPTRQAAIAAIAPVFPNSLALDPQSILDSVGIMIMTQYGQYCLSLSVASSPEDAIAQQALYQQPEYHKVRKSLGINSHWICNICVEQEIFWFHSDNRWMNAYTNFELDQSPDCWIFDHARNLNG